MPGGGPGGPPPNPIGGPAPSEGGSPGSPPGGGPPEGGELLGAVFGGDAPAGGAAGDASTRNWRKVFMFLSMSDHRYLWICNKEVFMKEMDAKDLVILLVTVVFPPLGVALKVGFGTSFWINLLLTFFGFYIAGLVHGIYVVLKN